MADPASIMLVGSEILAVGEIGLRAYLQHRKSMIDQGREDELISSRVRSYADTIKKSWSRESSPMVRFGDVYEEEKSDADEIPDKTDEVRLSFSKRLKRKSINGFNSAVNFLRKRYMPTTKSSLEETAVQLTEEVIENVVVPAIEKTKYNPLIYNWFIKKPSR